MQPKFNNAYDYFEQTDGNPKKEWTELTDYVNSIQKVIDENKTTVNDLGGNLIYSVENIVSESDEITGEAVTIGNTVYSVNHGDVGDIFSVGDTQLFTKVFEENDDGQLLSETISSVSTTKYGYNSDSSIGTLKNILNELTLEYSYGYNSKGNITAETLTRKAKGDLGETVDTVENVVYTYDSKQQLISAENNTTKWEYSYDNRGNILTTKEYAVFVGSDGEKTYTLKTDGNNTFAYDTDWHDKLSSFNGQSITYDDIGNPLSYKGNTLTWTMGRQLASYGSNTYKYNEDGIRTSKTVNGVTTKYYLNGTDIIEQTDGTNTLHFYYDNIGEIIGFTYNDNQYFYIKNLQNDIIAVADSLGNIVSQYAYDPWGAVISITGSNTEIGNLNPFRYRSYYYDSEIGMYYLQSRYYDPEICRFINCDDVNYIGFTESEISYNPFAYCENNAVNKVDANGNYGIVDLLDIFSKSVELIQNFLELTSNSCAKDMKKLKATIKSFTKKQKNYYNLLDDVSKQSKKVAKKLGTVGKVIIFVTILIGLVETLNKGAKKIFAFAKLLVELATEAVTAVASKACGFIASKVPGFGFVLNILVSMGVSYMLSQYFTDNRILNFTNRVHSKLKNNKNINKNWLFKTIFKTMFA